MITTTDLRYFAPEELEQARVVDLGRRRPSATDECGDGSRGVPAASEAGRGTME